MTRQERAQLRLLIDQARRETLNNQTPASAARRTSYADYYWRNRERILARRAERRTA